VTSGGGGRIRPHPNPQGAPQEAEHRWSQAGQGELGRRSGGLVVMNVYHKSGMWLAPRLMNVIYSAGLVRSCSMAHTSHTPLARGAGAEGRCAVCSAVELWMLGAF
jgi:hypothetical protein